MDDQDTDAKRVLPVIPPFLASFMWASKNCLQFVFGHAFLDFLVIVPSDWVITMNQAVTCGGPRQQEQGMNPLNKIRRTPVRLVVEDEPLLHNIIPTTMQKETIKRTTTQTISSRNPIPALVP
jgi:hypothetical protein